MHDIYGYFCVNFSKHDQLGSSNSDQFMFRLVGIHKNNFVLKYILVLTMATEGFQLLSFLFIVRNLPA